MRTLIAIPVYNEARSVAHVLSNVMAYLPIALGNPGSAAADEADILVIDDGSTDATPMLLAQFPVLVIRHGVNTGYGSAVIDAFTTAAKRGYDWVITMDCDEQHEPARLPDFFARQREADARRAAGQPAADILSGTRYPGGFGPGATTAPGSLPPPADRRSINATLTAEINALLRFDPPLTDTFCGFKSHRTSAVAGLQLTQTGYAFPMQLWAKVAAAGLRVEEVPVDLIYNDPSRTFGPGLADPQTRLAHYRQVLHDAVNTRAAGRWASGSAPDHPPACGGTAAAPICTSDR